MAGICSAHQGYDKDCRLCNLNLDTKDLDIETVVCSKCGFESYKTSEVCPKCRNKRMAEME